MNNNLIGGIIFCMMGVAFVIGHKYMGKGAVREQNRFWIQWLRLPFPPLSERDDYIYQICFLICGIIFFICGLIFIYTSF